MQVIQKCSMQEPELKTSNLPMALVCLLCWQMTVMAASSPICIGGISVLLLDSVWLTALCSCTTSFVVFFTELYQKWRVNGFLDQGLNVSINSFPS